MPKRLIDGEGIWRSDKLRLIQPAEYRAEYTNLLPLAFANGTFECDPHRVWSLVYAYNRSEITPEEVAKILDALEAAKLLFRWTDEKSGKICGYWAGIEKEGRLPPPNRMKNKHYLTGPTLPQPQYDHWLTNGRPEAPLAVAFGVASAVAVASAPASTPASGIGWEKTPPSQAIPLPPGGKGENPCLPSTTAATAGDPFAVFNTLDYMQDPNEQKGRRISTMPEMEVLPWMELAAREAGSKWTPEYTHSHRFTAAMTEIMRDNERTLGLKVFRDAWLNFIKTAEAEEANSPYTRFIIRLENQYPGVRIKTILDTLTSASVRDNQ